MTINPKFRGRNTSAGYPKLRNSGGKVNKSWGTPKTGGGSGGGGGGGGKKNSGCPLWSMLIVASAGSIANAAIQSIM